MRTWVSNSVFWINSVNGKGPDLNAAEGSRVGGYVWLMVVLLAISLTFCWGLYEIYRSQHGNQVLRNHTCTLSFIKSCLLAVPLLHWDKCLSATYIHV